MGNSGPPRASVTISVLRYASCKAPERQLRPGVNRTSDICRTSGSCDSLCDGSLIRVAAWLTSRGLKAVSSLSVSLASMSDIVCLTCMQRKFLIFSSVTGTVRISQHGQSGEYGAAVSLQGKGGTGSVSSHGAQRVCSSDDQEVARGTSLYQQLTTAELASMPWKSRGGSRLPRAFAVMLTHSSLSSLAAERKPCGEPDSEVSGLD